MSYTIKIIEQFLSLVPQFNQLPPETIANLAQQLRPLRYRMGQVMVMREKMQGQVAILCEGQARMLGYDPRTKMPTTLELIKPGQIIGWVNLARGIPCETAMASTEVVCLTLSNQDFANLLEQYPQLKRSFSNKPSLVEIFDLLGIQIEREAQGDLELKELAIAAAKEAEVYFLPPGEHLLHTELTMPLLEPERIWLVSGGGAIEGFAVGDRLEFTKEHQSITVEGSRPARLVSIPRQLWFDYQNDEHQQEAVLSSGISQIARQDGKVQTVNWGEEIEYAPDKLESVETDYDGDRKSKKSEKKDYPFFPWQYNLRGGGCLLPDD